MLKLPVSLKLELFLVSSVIFHRGVKLVASKMIGLDDVPSYLLQNNSFYCNQRLVDILEHFISRVLSASARIKH